jgi:hypothetical protein
VRKLLDNSFSDRTRGRISICECLVDVRQVGRGCHNAGCGRSGEVDDMGWADCVQNIELALSDERTDWAGQVV